MIVLLNLFVIFCVNIAVGAKTNFEVKNVKRFGEIIMENNYKAPILASVTRVNSKLEPVSLPFLANIHPNLNSRLQPAFTFVESGFNNQIPPISNKYPKVKDDDYFSSNDIDSKIESKNDKDTDEDFDEDSDYFGSNDNDPKTKVKNNNDPGNKSVNESSIDTDYFQSNEKDLKIKQESDKKSETKENSKYSSEEIDNYVDHKDNDSFYDDQVNITVLRRSSERSSNADVDENGEKNKFKCDDIICPSKTYSCKSTVEAIAGDFMQVEIITECLSSTDEVLATKTSKSDNPSGKYMFLIQTMNNDGNIVLSFRNQTGYDLTPQINETNIKESSESTVKIPKYTKLFVDDFIKTLRSNQNASESKSKRRKTKIKLQRIKRRFNMRKDGDDEDEEGPPIIITNPDEEDFDHFKIRRKYDSISVIEGNSSDYKNIYSRNNQRSNDDETNKDLDGENDDETYKDPEREELLKEREEEELNLVESEKLVCVGVECPRDAFKCKTFDDSIPPDFAKIRIRVECLTKDDVVVHNETIEKENFQKGIYMHSETLLNRYGELNTMTEHIVID